MKQKTKSIKNFFLKSNIISISVLVLLLIIFIYNTASTLITNYYNKKFTIILNTTAAFIEQNIEINVANIINYPGKNSSISKHISIEDELLKFFRYNSNLFIASGLFRDGTYIPDNSDIKPVDLLEFTMNNFKITNFNNNYYLTNLNAFIKKDKTIFEAISIIVQNILEDTYIIFVIDSSYLKGITLKAVYNISDFKEIRFTDRKMQNIFSVIYNDKETLLNNKTFNRTINNGFTLTLIPDYSLLNQDLSNLKISLFVLLLFYATFTLIQMSILRNKIYMPLKRMTELMSYIGMGHFDIKLIDRSWKEIELVSGGIDIMIEKINSLSREMYINKLLAIQTEIRTLQSQINPHFLFNTLNTIKLMVVKKKTDKTIKIINLLSEMLHYGIYDSNRTVTISDELYNVETYIKIIGYRFDKIINLSINCPQELLMKHTLKLILQPVIENSIKHGFSDIDPAEISITVIRDFTEIVFIIKDNGKGIPENILKQLSKNLKDGNISNRSSSIGLVNIENRLVLKYGSEYGLKIYSSRTTGTTIKISIPDYI